MSDSAMNPYMAPEAKFEEPRYESCWREGNILVMKNGSDLPHRCVKCNDEAVSPLRNKSLIWHHPGWYVLILLNFIIYLIAALLVRKRAKIAFGLCGAHVKRRRIVIAVSWTLFFAAAGSGFWTINSEGDHPAVLVVAILLLLSAIISAMFGFRLPYAKRITTDEVHVGGCGEAFLASLPTRSSF